MPLLKLRCTVARTAREIRDAQRIRWRVYGEEEQMLPPSVAVDGREIDARDDRPDTIHFVAYAQDEPVGTVRLLQSDPAATRRDRGQLGLDLESKVDLGMLVRPTLVPGEVTRFCVLRRYRCSGAAHALFTQLREESLRRGITHWVAGANMETDFVEDADLAYRVAGDRSLLSARFHAEAHVRPPHHTPRVRRGYTDEQRSCARDGDFAGLDLPRPVALFARRMGARFIGAPVYDSYFNVFALPLVAALGDLAVP